jgi:phosphinothricin acetyltransferase
VPPELSLSSLLGLIFGHNQPSPNLFHRFGFEDCGQMPQVCNLGGIKRDVMILGPHAAETTVSITPDTPLVPSL